VRIFGIDPGTDRTGYGCVEAEGSRRRMIACGALRTSASATLAEKLLTVHTGLVALIAECRPDCVAIEDLFYATNVRSVLKLGHVRGVAMLAAIEAGLPVAEYSPAEVKRAVVGYGRAEKHQVQGMVKLLLGLPTIPTPHDAADALAVAICHSHLTQPVAATSAVRSAGRSAASWRRYRPARP
jgi:crossover junction endodeoxyribonuclease RuvC